MFPGHIIYSKVADIIRNKGNVGKIAPNRINRRFNTSVPHQKITTDTTEFKYYEIDNKGRMVIKKLYLDPFLDMFNGEVLSYGISKNSISGKCFIGTETSNRNNI